VPERVLRLLHITDPHLHAHAESRMRGIATFDTFRAVIERAMEDPDPPQAILATGDLVQDETRGGYERIREVLETCNAPVFCIPGNHDSPDIMADVLGRPPFQFGGTMTRDNWTLILLNSFSAGDDGGRVSDADLQWMEMALEQNSHSHTLVCLHHHPVPMGSRWLDGVNLRNSDEFLAVVDRHPQVRGIIWGHVHQASDRLRKNVRLISTPSTCSQFLPDSDSFVLDTRPPGFRWLNLDRDGTIDTDVVWLE